MTQDLLYMYMCVFDCFCVYIVYVLYVLGLCIYKYNIDTYIYIQYVLKKKTLRNMSKWLFNYDKEFQKVPYYDVGII